MLAVRSTPAANSILRTLSHKGYQHLLTSCKQVKLNYGDILCETGDKIRYVYFVNSGLVSLLTPVAGYARVEVGLVGCEGMAGISLLMGIGISPVRMLVQGKGIAMRMKAAQFSSEIKYSPVLHRGLNRYLYVLLAQVSQTAACNIHHHIAQRLARWLLMTQDRAKSDEFYLTQDFLSHMLGVRRVSVSTAAAVLQKKNLIQYRRGTITVLDRKGLERASCQCYRAVNDIRDRMLG